MQPHNPDSSISPLDLAVASLSFAALLLSLASASAVLYLRLITSDLSPPRRRRPHLSVLNSLWPIRLLLVLSASLVPLSSLLRILRPETSCHAYILSFYAFAQPTFLATLLFLLRATTNPSPSSATVSSAVSAALFCSLPFLALHAVFLSHYVLPLRRIGLTPDIFGQGLTATADASCCCYPLFGTVLLAALGAVYVPLFVSSGWGAVSVVINKKLRLRLYVLVATVVAGVPLQVAALAVSALLAPDCQMLGFVAFFAVLACTVAGVVILVGQPIADALAVGEENEREMDGWEGSNAELMDVRTDDDVARAVAPGS